ncbi:putative RNA-directed DNA polymerase, partial [Tanacetum coccineum]
MVEGGKPPKDKGVASGSNGGDIDQFDLLYLHSNDTNGIPLIGFKLEGTENYKIWKAAITIAIHTKNKLGFINGKITRPVEEGFMQEQWDRCNSVVLNWILGCVSQDVFLGQVFSKNAKTVWDELEETYSKQDASVIFNMYYKIHSLYQSGAPLSKYYHKFNALRKKYDSFVNLPDCTCANSDKLKEHNQILKLMQFLIGLDEVYAPIRSIVLTTDPIPDVRGAFVTLSRDESHRSTQSHSVPKIGNDNTAFVARTNSRVNNNNNNWSGSNNQPRNLNRPNLVYTYCNMNGHTPDRCFELIGYPPNFKKHMTYTVINMFNIVDVSKLNMTVGHPNGTKALVTHIGSPKLTKNIVIHNVLVVPGYQVSLLSVHSLSKDNKFRVIFDEDTCVIQDSVLKTQVGTGNESNGLYFRNTGNKLVNNNIQVCCLSKCIWHNRLGHPSDQVLDILRHKLNFETNTKIDLCEVCHKAKQTREPFPISEHKTKSLGDLVHLDVWGPYKVQSREGYKYLLTIVDDYTRCVWVFPLRGKMKFFLISFYNLLKNQFNESIKVFRSDNGTEFVNQSMTKFCNDHGILHQTSCAYTPQQNGITERKYRHLLNVARSLMFKGRIPLNTWSECVLTSVYLINRTPSSMLSGKSPYEMIFKCEPNLSHLKVFGCLCFSTILDNHDKFSSRFEKSVFIGYSFDKKGYKLFSLKTKKIFYSRDVKFYETVFPFKNSSENKDYELELKDLNSLNFFNNDLGEDLSSEPYDDRRDSNSGNSKGTDQLSHGGTENTGNANKDDGRHPNDIISEAATCEDLESAILEDNSLSEGDGTDYQEFNNQFQNQSPVLNPDRQNEN